VYSYSKTNKMHLFLKLFILVKHYMFRTVFPSIIGSSKLHIQQQAYVKLELKGWVKLLVYVYVGYSKT
jgi:hypothetical protein